MNNVIVELGRFEAIKNGVPLKYIIQRVTPELINEVMDFMVKYFLTREPMTSYDKFLEDPEALNDIKDLWRKGMESGTAIVALKDTPDGSIDIVGANMTVISKLEDKVDEKSKSEKYDKLLISLMELIERGNIYKKYNVDKYLCAYGLTVHPNYHGYQIGYRILESRKPLCKAFGLTVTGTVFTAQVSQHIASKVGFEILSQQDYKTIIYNNKTAYPNLDGDMKFMAIKYQM